MVWALCLTAASVVTIRAANDTSVTAAQINGTRGNASGPVQELGAGSSPPRSNSPSPLNTKEKLVRCVTPLKVTAMR
jgi:hypothetical protein